MNKILLSVAGEGRSEALMATITGFTAYVQAALSGSFQY